jgi:hypothetical protein
MGRLTIPPQTYPPYPNQKLPYITWKERGGWTLSWPAQASIPAPQCYPIDPITQPLTPGTTLFFAIYSASSDPAYNGWLQDWEPVTGGPCGIGIENGPLHAQCTYTALFASSALVFAETFVYTLKGQ